MPAFNTIDGMATMLQIAVAGGGKRRQNFFPRMISARRTKVTKSTIDLMADLGTARRYAGVQSVVAV